MTTFLPLAVTLTSDMGALDDMARLSCNGVRGSSPVTDMATVPDGYTGHVFMVDTQEISRADDLTGNASFFNLNKLNVMHQILITF